MRELKFRGKCINTNKWVYGGFYSHEEYAVIIHKQGNNLSHFTEVDPLSVCQYIGLDDKNGYEIYENDIFNDSTWNHLNFVVIYKNGMFCSENRGFTYDFESDLDPATIEVVGNTIDNALLISK